MRINFGPLYPTADPKQVKLSWDNYVMASLERTNGLRVLARQSSILFLTSVQEMAFKKDSATHAQQVGSAFFVSPLVLISARHVFDNHLPLTSEDFASGKKMSAEYGAFSFDRTGKHYTWGVVEWNTSKYNDVAVISCEASGVDKTDFRGASLPIHQELPTVGEELWSFGLSSHASENPLTIVPLVNSGKVIDVWENGADSVICHGPSFAIDCLTVPGMSGGPIIDIQGRVRGVITSCLDEGNGRGVTFGSSLLNVGQRRVMPQRPRPDAGARTLLSELEDVDLK